MYIPIYMYICVLSIYIYKHTNICMYIFTYIHSYIHMHIHVYMYVYLHTYVYMYIRRCGTPCTTGTSAGGDAMCCGWCCAVKGLGLAALSGAPASKSCHPSWGNATWCTAVEVSPPFFLALRLFFFRVLSVMSSAFPSPSSLADRVTWPSSLSWPTASTPGAAEPASAPEASAAVATAVKLFAGGASRKELC